MMPSPQSIHPRSRAASSGRNRSNQRLSQSFKAIGINDDSNTISHPFAKYSESSKVNWMNKDKLSNFEQQKH
jgi:hypothetical protein